jgi:hypothetical protein
MKRVRSQKRFFRVSLALLACLAVAACPRDTLDSIVVNDTASVITVSYQLRHPDPRVYPPGTCGLTLHPGRLSQDPKSWTRDFGTHRPIAWQRLEGEVVDLERCRLTARIEPGDGLHVATDSWCADDVTAARAGGNARLEQEPDVIALSVTSGGQTRSYEGWQVAEQFQRQPSGHCLFEIRSEQ